MAAGKVQIMAIAYWILIVAVVLLAAALIAKKTRKSKAVAPVANQEPSSEKQGEM